MLSFLDRKHSLANEGYNRWLAPPAALAIHLSIGQVYAFSVFKNPLLALAAPDGSHWNLKAIGYIFSLAIGVLGLSAALFGHWLERAGPRKAMFAAAICFGLGFYIAAFGVTQHSLLLIYLGYGLVGGIGLGLGYISPVSTLIKWFPDRPGLSTGLAIMGFGGGAMIGGPLGTTLMAHFKNSSHQPIAAAWIVMGTLYFVFMMFGVFTIRIPHFDWRPAGWHPPAKPSALVTKHNVDVSKAWRTPQFVLLWIVLCMNVTAGIGIIEQASPMIQDLFRVTAYAAAGFVGLLSLFNMAGRFLWASLSDYIGRKNTYFIFFVLGAALYFFLPLATSVAVFVAIACIVLTMYGGGFATIPAYLRDLFGTHHVSAIHGRLLTAWSVAGICGPLLVNGLLDHYVHKHTNLTPLAARQAAYPLILHIMAGLLVIGFFANLLVRPVASKYWLPAPSNTQTP
jgi:MFS family permease